MPERPKLKAIGRNRASATFRATLAKLERTSNERVAHGRPHLSLANRGRGFQIPEKVTSTPEHATHRHKSEQPPSVDLNCSRQQCCAQAMYARRGRSSLESMRTTPLRATRGERSSGTQPKGWSARH